MGGRGPRRLLLRGPFCVWRDSDGGGDRATGAAPTRHVHAGARGARTTRGAPRRGEGRHVPASCSPRPDPHHHPATAGAPTRGELTMDNAELMQKVNAAVRQKLEALQEVADSNTRTVAALLTQAGITKGSGRPADRGLREMVTKAAGRQLDRARDEAAAQVND